jgi:thioredoxin-dependent peroxiredoxin
MLAFRRTLVTMFAVILAPVALAEEPSAPAAPMVGTPAPAFRLQDQTGEWHTLEQQAGKWVVLYFYPKDNTPGCTTQACELRDNIFAYRRANVVVLGVSVDDVESHKKFATEHSLPFPILADSSRTTGKAYGVLHVLPDGRAYTRRETFLIDPQGKIAKHYPSVSAKGHSDRVLADLKALGAPIVTAPEKPAS